MLININGWPGSGKLTVGQRLAEKLGGYLVDNHSLIDLAAAVTVRGSPSFYETVRDLRKIVFARILEIPGTTPVVLTNVVVRGTASRFSEENWSAIQQLAVHRGCELYAVRLTCSPEENRRRLMDPERALRGKMRDQAALSDAISKYTLFDDGAAQARRFDDTSINPDQCSDMIVSWLRGM